MQSPGWHQRRGRNRRPAPTRVVMMLGRRPKWRPPEWPHLVGLRSKAISAAHLNFLIGRIAYSMMNRPVLYCGRHRGLDPSRRYVQSMPPSLALGLRFFDDDGPADDLGRIQTSTLRWTTDRRHLPLVTRRERPAWPYASTA